MDENNRKDVIKWIVKWYLITRCGLVLMMIVFNFLLPSGSSIYSNIFEIFDNEHYLNIAINGYQSNYLYAFFPLTPLLIRYLGKWGFLVLNQLLVVMSGYLLYLISKDIFKEKENLWVVFLFLISPISVFTCMFYTEGIFLFLTILGFYLYKCKKNYFALGLVLGLSVMTRSLGSMLFFSIFICMFINMIKGKEKFKNILITYIPATIISCLYPIYLYIRTGNFLYFTEVQFLYWDRTGTNILMVLFDSFKYLVKDLNYLYALNYILTVFLLIYIVYVIIKNRHEKKYYEIFLYIVFSLIAICSTIRHNGDAVTSYYRYIFGCFPIYFMILPKQKNMLIILFLTTFITTMFLLGVYFY